MLEVQTFTRWAVDGCMTNMLDFSGSEKRYLPEVRMLLRTMLCQQWVKKGPSIRFVFAHERSNTMLWLVWWRGLNHGSIRVEFSQEGERRFVKMEPSALVRKIPHMRCKWEIVDGETLVPFGNWSLPSGGFAYYVDGVRVPKEYYWEIHPGYSRRHGKEEEVYVPQV